VHRRGRLRPHRRVAQGRRYMAQTPPVSRSRRAVCRRSRNVRDGSAGSAIGPVTAGEVPPR
jgi:hypothetical protein